MTDGRDWHWEDVGGGFMKKVSNTEASVSSHHPYTKTLCVRLAKLHEKEADEAKRDLELAMAETPQLDYLIELFTKRYNEETRFAEAWRRSVNEAPE